MDTCPRCGAPPSPDLEWCGQCYVRFDPPPAPPNGSVVLVTMSSGRGGDTLGLPWPLRAGMTIGVLGGGVLLIVGFGPWWELGRPLWALGTVLLTIHASLGGLLVARLWAPDTFDRREERIVVLDKDAIDAVERRQQGLIQHEDPPPAAAASSPSQR